MADCQAPRITWMMGGQVAKISPRIIIRLLGKFHGSASVHSQENGENKHGMFNGRKGIEPSISGST